MTTMTQDKAGERGNPTFMKKVAEYFGIFDAVFGGNLYFLKILFSFTDKSMNLCSA
jgi:hypothetical protein